MATTVQRSNWKQRQRELDEARVRFAASLAEMDRMEAAKKVRPSPAPRRATTMELGRNRDGVLFVRQPIGDPGRERIVTWHIDPRGEADLCALGITVGSALPSGLLSRLRAEGKLYTGTAPARPQSPSPSPARGPRRTGWTWSRWHDGQPA